MDSRQLENFTAYLEQKSFLPAAESFFTFQPNISKSIGKGVIVTQQGDKFYHYAKSITP